eukprot:149253_1
MTTIFVHRLKLISNRTKHVVYGFIRQQHHLLYYPVPLTLQQLCLLYYHPIDQWDHTICSTNIVICAFDTSIMVPKQRKLTSYEIKRKKGQISCYIARCRRVQRDIQLDLNIKSLALLRNRLCSEQMNTETILENEDNQLLDEYFVNHSDVVYEILNANLDMEKSLQSSFAAKHQEIINQTLNTTYYPLIRPYHGKKHVAFLKQIVECGVYRWRFKIKTLPKFLDIGIWKVDSNKIPIKRTSYLMGKRDNRFYSFDAVNGTLVDPKRSSFMRSYAVACKDDNIVEMTLNALDLTLSFGINGNDLGNAFKVENTSYRAFVRLCAAGSARLIESGLI